MHQGASFKTLQEIYMLGLIARWGHNVLLATMGLLTIAMLVLLAR
jgi:hypothetical protein